MSPSVRRIATAALMIAWLRHPSAADPVPSSPAPEPGPERAHHDPDAAPTPWIDLGTSPVPATPAATTTTDHRVAAALTLGGLYAGFTTWTYFAWYRKHKPLSEFRWGGDGLFGANTYAGGADKLGHAWATLGLARLGTEMLYQWGGYSRVTSTLVASALSELLFIGVEVKDGFYYEFSYGDAAADTLGALVAVAQSLSPRFDELFDFRVEYWPSREYRRQLDGGNVNIAEDYTGETYLLALHLGGIHALRDARWGGWSRFVDVAIGYGTRGYKPDPPKGEIDYVRRQELSFGLSLNVQGLSDWLFEGRSKPAKKIGHAVFEVFNFGYVPAQTWKRVPEGDIDQGGA